MTPIMRIYQGPPGTGKTYRAKLAATQIVDKSANETNFRSKYKSLSEGGQIAFVAFHANYAYEDFVEGFRPLRDKDTKDLYYEVVKGPFRRICETFQGTSPQSSLPESIQPTFIVGEKIGLKKNYTVVEISPSVLVLESQGYKKSGKLLHHVAFRTIKHLQDSGIRPADLSEPGTDEGRKNRAELSRKAHFPNTAWNNSSAWRAVYQRLLDTNSPILASQPTLKTHPQTDFQAVIIIDEINRADLSKVFGELLTLIEADKRIGAENETWITLPYSQRSFAVPNGLHILGTMNTTDKSLSVFDIALRRRFTFWDVQPQPELCASIPNLDLKAALTAINHRMVQLKSPDFQLGHSDFMTASIEAVRHNHFDSYSDALFRSVAYIFRKKTIPLLEEYFQGRRSLVQKALGATPYVTIPFAIPMEEDGPTEPQLTFDERLDPFGTKWEPSHFQEFFRSIHRGS